MRLLKHGADRKILEEAAGRTFKSPPSRQELRLQIRTLLQNQFYPAPISLALGCSDKTILNWKRRFLAGDGLLDLSRSGRPRIIPSEVDHRLIAFYCQHNPLPGCSRWTIRWAFSFLTEHQEILRCSITRSSIHRRLNSHALRPYRNKYFLQIMDPLFFEKMELIIELYLNPPKYLFCLDECTGLQALERFAPTLPPQGQKPAYQEPNYKRHGTVSIFSILYVSNGHVFTECIQDHTASTVISCIKKHVAQFPESVPLHYILDNYSSHSTDDVCRGIAELCNVDMPRLKTSDERKEWMKSPGKRIIFHFLPTHGSWLNMIEIWFGILQQKAIKNQSFSSTRKLQERILKFTETWDAHFAHPFQWSYKGEGLHEKVISRFTTWLKMESTQLTAKFLEKQIRLILNLATNYWSKAKQTSWTAFSEALHDKSEYIKTITGANKNLASLHLNLCLILNNKLKAY